MVFSWLVSSDFYSEIGDLFKPMFKPKLVMNTTLTTVLYTSKTLSDGTHPLMLQLTKNRRTSLHMQPVDPVTPRTDDDPVAHDDGRGFEIGPDLPGEQHPAAAPLDQIDVAPHVARQ